MFKIVMDFFYRNEELCSVDEQGQQLTQAVAKADAIIKNKQRLHRRRQHNGYTDTWKRNFAAHFWAHLGLPFGTRFRSKTGAKKEGPNGEPKPKKHPVRHPKCSDNAWFRFVNYA